MNIGRIPIFGLVRKRGEGSDSEDIIREIVHRDILVFQDKNGIGGVCFDGGGDGLPINGAAAHNPVLVGYPMITVEMIGQRPFMESGDNLGDIPAGQIGVADIQQGRKAWKLLKQRQVFRQRIQDLAGDGGTEILDTDRYLEAREQVGQQFQSPKEHLPGQRGVRTGQYLSSWMDNQITSVMMGRQLKGPDEILNHTRIW